MEKKNINLQFNKKGNIIGTVAVEALDESLHRNARRMAPRHRLAPFATSVARVGL